MNAASQSHASQSHASHSIRSQALSALTHHKMTPETLLLQIKEDPIQLVDEHKNKWTFVSRHRCRRYLMAKTTDMHRYEEVYVSR
jgi:hypothetical protein